MRGLIAVFLIAFALAAGILAGGPAAGAVGERVALVVGNGAYQAASPLANPANDAAAVGAALQRVGFHVTTIVDADYRAMAQAIRSFGSRAHGAEVALFFYAGHGLQVYGENFLLPVTASIDEPGDLRYEAFTLSLVLAELEEAEPGLSVVILDACRDNPITRRLTRQAQSLGRSVSVGQGLAATQGGTGTLIAYATAPGELALDGDGANSPFTEALVRWIVEPDLEVGLMFRRVRETVLSTTGGAQVPWVEESIVGEFYFNPRRSGPTASGGPTGPVAAAPVDTASAAGPPAPAVTPPPAAPAVTPPPTAPAGAQLTVRNRGSARVLAVYASPTTSGNWDRNRIGAGGLPPGHEVVIPLGEYGSVCEFDVRLIDENQGVRESWSLDVCRQSMIEFF